MINKLNILKIIDYDKIQPANAFINSRKQMQSDYSKELNRTITK